MRENIQNNNETPDINSRLFWLAENSKENINWSLQFSDFLKNKNNKEELAAFFEKNLNTDTIV